MESLEVPNVVLIGEPNEWGWVSGLDPDLSDPRSWREDPEERNAT